MVLGSDVENGFGGGRATPSERSKPSRNPWTNSPRKHALPFQLQRFIFLGSWAKGMTTFHSDADVCVFLESWEGKKIDVLVEISLMSLELS